MTQTQTKPSKARPIISSNIRQARCPGAHVHDWMTMPFGTITRIARDFAEAQIPDSIWSRRPDGLIVEVRDLDTPGMTYVVRVQRDVRYIATPLRERA